MKITPLKENGVWIIQLDGTLDSFTSKNFEELLLEGITQANTKIILDAAHLEYVSSAGLRIFYVAAQRLRERGGKMVFCALTPHVRRVFEIVDMASEFQLFTTRADAMKEFMT